MTSPTVTRSLTLPVGIYDATHLRYVAAPLQRPRSGPTSGGTFLDGSRTTAWTRALPATIQRKAATQFLEVAAGRYRK